MSAENTFTRINRLPDNLVNQIAAGEVIERPASVVKEVIENSLDAGATKLTIEIENSGSGLIRVSDNGHGVHVDDLVLALDRHTTSKINVDSDLARIATLGFRGEALSSIASVSRLSLTSRWQGSEYAWNISYSVNDNSYHVVPAAHPAGTTVEVKNLFYNTPARRKFLSSEKTEFLRIQEMVKRAALSRYDLKINLNHNKRKILTLTDDSQNPLKRIGSVIGRQFVSQAISVNEQNHHMAIYGWIAPPDFSRSQSDMQFVYLNGRIIRDKLVAHAIRLAYQDKIHTGRYPLFVLYIETDLNAADINVHPTKHEVRFRDPRSMHDFIYGCLARQLEMENQDNDYQTTAGRNTTGMLNTYSHFQGKGLQINDTATDYTGAVCHSLLNGRFLLSELDGCTQLMDVHAARTAISHYKLQEEWKHGRIPARPVLVPLLFKCREDDCDGLIEYSALLKAMAVDITAVSPLSVQIRSLPMNLPYCDVIRFLGSFLSQLQKKPDGVPADTIIDLLAMHANDLAPVSLTNQEMNSLLIKFSDIREKLPAGNLQRIVRQVDAESLLEFLQRG